MRAEWIYHRSAAWREGTWSFVRGAEKKTGALIPLWMLRGTRARYRWADGRKHIHLPKDTRKRFICYVHVWSHVIVTIQNKYIICGFYRGLAFIVYGLESKYHKGTDSSSEMRPSPEELWLMGSRSQH